MPNHDADCFDEVVAYYTAQLKIIGWTLADIRETKGGCIALINNPLLEGIGGHTYKSFYVYKSERGKGHYKRFASELTADDIVLTFDTCNLKEALDHMGVHYLLVATRSIEAKAWNKRCSDKTKLVADGIRSKFSALIDEVHLLPNNHRRELLWYMMKEANYELGVFEGHISVNGKVNKPE